MESSVYLFVNDLINTILIRVKILLLKISVRTFFTTRAQEKGTGYWYFSSLLFPWIDLHC